MLLVAGCAPRVIREMRMQVRLIWVALRQDMQRDRGFNANTHDLIRSKHVLCTRLRRLTSASHCDSNCSMCLDFQIASRSFLVLCKYCFIITIGYNIFKKTPDLECSLKNNRKGHFSSVQTCSACIFMYFMNNVIVCVLPNY